MPEPALDAARESLRDHEATASGRKRQDLASAPWATADVLAPGRSSHDAEAPAIIGGPPVREHPLVFGEPQIDEVAIDAVAATLRSGWIGMGPKVRRFEERFEEYMGVRHACATSSCTSGLELALQVAGVRPGDEVITTPTTFAATANVIVHLGATPVFADVDRQTMLIDSDDLERRITPRTRAIVPVHIAGRACEMTRLREIADRHNVALVADCAHAIETQYRGRPVASLADLSVLSFYVTKNLTTIEGGMVLTDNAAWAEEVRLLRNHGLSRDAWHRHSAHGFQPYEAILAGHKCNMTDVQAVLGLRQLETLEASLEVRERHWHTYRAELEGLDGIALPDEDPEPTNRHARHLFVVLLELERLSLSRDEIAAALAAENIGTGVHFTALHLHRFYRERFGFNPGDYPRAEWIGERTLSLPLSAKLSDADVADVVRAVQKTLAFAWRP